MRLDPSLLPAVLRHLGLPPAPPSRHYLDRLISAYTCSVPWESVFRIARRARTAQLEACPRWPTQFWTEALDNGAGGTCFESNYAFLALLQSLGFEGYLTINNMGEKRGCHTAIVVTLGRERWLVDAGFPLYLPVPINHQAPTQRVTPFHTYTTIPHGNGSLSIQRNRHPNPYTFTLIDQPVEEATYRAATLQDYGPDGHFLDRVIITKVIAYSIWRYDSAVGSHLEVFQDGRQTKLPIAGDGPATLGQLFQMDPGEIQAAQTAIGLQIGD